MPAPRAGTRWSNRILVCGGTDDLQTIVRALRCSSAARLLSANSCGRSWVCRPRTGWSVRGTAGLLRSCNTSISPTPVRLRSLGQHPKRQAVAPAPAVAASLRNYRRVTPQQLSPTCEHAWRFLSVLPSWSQSHAVPERAPRNFLEICVRHRLAPAVLRPVRMACGSRNGHPVSEGVSASWVLLCYIVCLQRKLGYVIQPHTT